MTHSPLRICLLALVALGLSSFALDSPVRADDRVLLIGDSHTVGTFGHRMDELLRTVPQAQVQTVASCGSSPFWWFNGQPTTCGFFEHDADGSVRNELNAPTPLLQDLLNRFHPTLTIVALGANMMHDAPLDYVADTTGQMARMIAQAGSRCAWVGPPSARIFTEPHVSEVDGILRGASAPGCIFVDSRAYTHYPDQGGDGLHYDSLGPEGQQMAREWAEKVFAELRDRLHLAR